jgi:hypothetical protein
MEHLMNFEASAPPEIKEFLIDIGLLSNFVCAITDDLAKKVLSVPANPEEVAFTVYQGEDYYNKEPKWLVSLNSAALVWTNYDTYESKHYLLQDDYQSIYHIIEQIYGMCMV